MSYYYLYRMYTRSQSRSSQRSADIPAQIFIRNGEVLNEPPEKEHSPKTPENPQLFRGIDYDNSPPTDKSGNTITYFNKQCGDHKTRDKKGPPNALNDISGSCRCVKDWNTGKYDSKSSLAEIYGMSVVNVRRYLNMSDEEVEKIKDLKERGKRKTDMDGYMNIVYKMLAADEHKPAFLYSAYKIRREHPLSRKPHKSHRMKQLWDQA